MAEGGEMVVIYDYWPFDEEWRHVLVRQMITYPPYSFDPNESVWIVPGTMEDE